MFKITRFFAVAALFTFLLSCKKNTATTTEVNTLGGSPGACTSTAFAGTYTKGVAFNGSQNVTIQVNVKTVPSLIRVSTNIVNGVSFQNPSTSLTFTTLGVQNLVIGGQGTPLNSGTYTFTLTMYRSLDNSDISTCSFPINFN